MTRTIDSMHMEERGARPAPPKAEGTPVPPAGQAARPAAAALQPASEHSAYHEECLRFRYFGIAMTGGWLLLALGYGLLGNIAMVLTGLLLAATMQLLRNWALAGGHMARLQLAVQLMTAATLLAQFWQILVLHESVAGWYVPMLPLGVAVFCSLRAGVIWVGISVTVILFLGWAEPRTQQLHPEAATSVLVARCILAMLITVFGIAARRTRDQHVQALNANLAELRKAQAEAQRANEAKSAFLATMSHELRTPLNAVIGLNSLMLESSLPPLQRHQAELACQAGETMLHLVNEILDFSRIESGRLELEKQAFSPRQVMEECLALVATRAAEKQVRLRSEIEVPLRLCGDEARLRQILLNLLTNALKFTPDGEVLLRCSEHPSQGRSWLYVEVRDTGIGIAPAALARIFQPFEQADASTTRLYGGTGLGLAICRGLVAAMGGKIGVDSSPGQGSTFWFELPFDTAPAAAIPPPVPAVPRSRSVPGTARILLAEDNSTNQFVALEMFRKLGHELQVVSNGREAVEAAAAQRYDLIFMDCHMLVMDGLEASRAIRAGEAPGQHTPIIAMTALAFKSDRENCFAAGMDDYLAKPVRLQELAQLLARWLGSTAARPAADAPLAADRPDS